MSTRMQEVSHDLCMFKTGKNRQAWGVFIRHLLQMQDAGIRVEYERKGEVTLNGKKYKPVYFENTMRYEPIGWHYKEQYIVLIGHDIQPLIDYLKKEMEVNQ